MSKSFAQQYIYYKYVDLSHGDLFNKKIMTIHAKHGPNTSCQTKDGCKVISGGIGVKCFKVLDSFHLGIEEQKNGRGRREIM